MASFVIAAAFELPVALELGAGRRFQPGLDRPPGRAAMSGHVISGDLVRDALIAESFDRPIKNAGCVAGFNRS
jgi:hypothetical protein